MTALILKGNGVDRPFQKGFIKNLDGRSVTEKWTYFETKLPSQTCGHRQYSELDMLAGECKNLLLLGNTFPRKWGKRREKSQVFL